MACIWLAGYSLPIPELDNKCPQNFIKITYYHLEPIKKKIGSRNLILEGCTVFQRAQRK
jgi:hypothetical protein